CGAAAMMEISARLGRSRAESKNTRRQRCRNRAATCAGAMSPRWTGRKGESAAAADSCRLVAAEAHPVQINSIARLCRLLSMKALFASLLLSALLAPVLSAQENAAPAAKEEPAATPAPAPATAEPAPAPAAPVPPIEGAAPSAAESTSDLTP